MKTTIYVAIVVSADGTERIGTLADRPTGPEAFVRSTNECIVLDGQPPRHARLESFEIDIPLGQGTCLRKHEPHWQVDLTRDGATQPAALFEERGRARRWLRLLRRRGWGRRAQLVELTERSERSAACSATA